MSYESISLVFVIVSVLPVTFRASAERDRLGKNNRTYSVFEMKQCVCLLFPNQKFWVKKRDVFFFDVSLSRKEKKPPHYILTHAHKQRDTRHRIRERERERER